LSGATQLASTASRLCGHRQGITLGVVAELVRRGHRVTYPVPAAFVGAIEEAGAEAVLYESPLQQRVGPPRRLTGSFFVNFQLRLLEEALTVAPVLEEYLAGDRPA
jgi:hypothetical protein